MNVFAAASDPTFFSHLCALQCRTLQFGDPLPSVMCTPCIPQRGFMSFSAPVPKRFTHLRSVSLLACVHCSAVHCSAVQVLCSRCPLLTSSVFLSSVNQTNGSGLPRYLRVNVLPTATVIYLLTYLLTYSMVQSPS